MVELKDYPNFFTWKTIEPNEVQSILDQFCELSKLQVFIQAYMLLKRIKVKVKISKSFVTTTKLVSVGRTIIKRSKCSLLFYIGAKERWEGTFETLKLHIFVTGVSADDFFLLFEVFMLACLISTTRYRLLVDMIVILCLCDWYLIKTVGKCKSRYVNSAKTIKRI